jgi:hypothetical protein
MSKAGNPAHSRILKEFPKNSKAIWLLQKKFTTTTTIR